MDCPRCNGFVSEVTERDDEGEYCDCLRCCNCGWRQYAERVGKHIEVVKGENYGQYPL